PRPSPPAGEEREKRQPRNAKHIAPLKRGANEKIASHRFFSLRFRLVWFLLREIPWDCQELGNPGAATCARLQRHVEVSDGQIAGCPGATGCHHFRPAPTAGRTPPCTQVCGSLYLQSCW